MAWNITLLHVLHTSILLDDDCVMNMENMILLVDTHIRTAGLGLSYHPYVVKLKHFDLVLNKIDFPWIWLFDFSLNFYFYKFNTTKSRAI